MKYRFQTACMCCGTIHPPLARKCKGPCGVKQRHWRALTLDEQANELERMRLIRATFDSLIRAD